MVAMAFASYPHSRILFLVELTAAGVSLLAVGASDLLRRRDSSRALRGAKRVLTGEESYALQEFGLAVAVVGRAGTSCGPTRPLPIPWAVAVILWGRTCCVTSTPKPSGR